MMTIYVGASKGMQIIPLPDGRTITLYGLNSLAVLSDGQEVYVGGVGYVAIPPPLPSP